MQSSRSGISARVSKKRLTALLPLILLGSVFGNSAGARSTSDFFVGHTAPDFKLKDLEGHEVELSSLKGNIVVLDFWASWCAACRAEMPSIQSIAKHLAKKNVVVIGVNLDEPADVVRRFVTKNKLTYPIVLTIDNPAFIQAYAAMTLPTVAVIDENGIIAAYRVGESSRTEEMLLGDIHHVSSSKYVAPRPKAVQMAQMPPVPTNPSRPGGPDPNWQPKTAEEFLARGYARLQTHLNPQAKADAEEAPSLPRPGLLLFRPA